MKNEDDLLIMKQILQNMSNCEITLEEYCEILDKESLGKLSFTFLKSSFEKYYPSISKSKIIS